MNEFIQTMVGIYSKLLNLYPRGFRDEYADEMQVVFGDALNEAVQEGTLPLALVCLRELGGLPFSILREFWHEFSRKETIMLTNEKGELGSVSEGGTGFWNAFIGALPFALFGMVSMSGKSSLPIQAGYIDLAFCFMMLIGLVIGLVQGFPRWAYSYLGWSMVMSWSWMMMPVDTFQRYRSPLTHDQLIGWWSWTPLLGALLAGVLFGRARRPLHNMFRGLWQDWTLVSLLLYTFVALVLLIYDENHHPYLFLFMIASTIILSASTWFFLQSMDTRKRVISLLSGFVLAFTVMFICDATWDWHAYYGYTKPPGESEYLSALRYAAFLMLYGAVLFLPALPVFIRRAINNRRTV